MLLPQAMGQRQAEEESLGQFQGNRSIQIAVSGELFDFHEGCWLEAMAKPGLNIFSLWGGDFKFRPYPLIPWLSCFICLMQKFIARILSLILAFMGTKMKTKAGR